MSIAFIVLILALLWFLRSRPQSVVHAIPTATPPSALLAIPAGTSRPDPTLTLTPRPTATPVGGGGVIVYDAWRGGNRDLYLKSLAGGEPIRLTSHPAEDRAPAWSPDGTRIAFESHRDGNWELYLIDLPTGELRRLTDDPHFDGDPAWSPDGTRLAFASHRQGDLDVFVLDLRDGQISQLTDDPTPDYDPAWSPDGRYVAFVAWRDSLPTVGPDEQATDTDWNRDIFVAPADGSTQPINLTRAPSDDYDPAWAPAANRLAFISDRSGMTRPYTLELPPQVDVLESASLLEELPPQPVQSSGGLVSQPVWSPDGLALAYVAEGRGEWTLTLASVLPDGGVAHLLRASEAVGAPAWWSNLSVPVAQAVGDVSYAQWIEPDGIDVTPTPVFVENLDPTPEAGAPYRLNLLPGVTGGNPKLSDRVDDSYTALRARVEAETGLDLLATIGDGLRGVSYAGEGSSYMSWHKAGRAVDLSIDTNGSNGQPIMAIVREDRSGRTWWRLYLRAARQDGSQGEPLKVAPWSFFARFTDEAAAEAGGRRLAVPAGYWIDFTSLAAQYGWRRIPANDRRGLAWREDWNAIEYWHFENRGGLSWWEAMREVYDEATLDEHY